ncbi:hemicentin-1-like isoform X2 [Rhodnius prolixus]|uniref:hemicentin-1-like isoform X2 n=1 Tax=Rhodnius prolixus TaxID=13249 RepID=UPI003D18C0F7
MQRKCSYFTKIIIIFIVTLALTLLSPKINLINQQSESRFPRSVLDELKGANEDELWNFLIKNSNKKENNNFDYNEATEDDDFGSLFDEDDEETISTTETPTTMLPRTPMVHTTGMSIVEYETTKATVLNTAGITKISTFESTVNTIPEETTTSVNITSELTTKSSKIAPNFTTGTIPTIKTTPESTTGTTPTITMTSESTTETTPEIKTTSESTTGTTATIKTTSESTTGTTPTIKTTSESTTGTTPTITTTPKSTTGTTATIKTTSGSTSGTTPTIKTTPESTTGTTPTITTTPESTTGTTATIKTTSESTTGTTPTIKTTPESTTDTTPTITSTPKSTTETTATIKTTSESTTGTTPTIKTTPVSTTGTTPTITTTPESTTGTTATIKTTSESTTGATSTIKTTPESTTDTTPTIKTTPERTTGTTPTIKTTPEITMGTTATIKTTPESTTGTIPTIKTTPKSTTGTTATIKTTSGSTSGTTPTIKTTPESTTGTTPTITTTPESTTGTTATIKTTSESTTGTTPTIKTTPESTTDTTPTITSTPKSTTETTATIKTTSESTTGTTPTIKTTPVSTTGTTPTITTTPESTTGTTATIKTTSESTTGATSTIKTTPESTTDTTPTIKTTPERTTGTTPTIKTTPEITMGTTATIKTTPESTTGTIPTIKTTPKSTTGTTATIKTTPVSTIGTTPTIKTTPERTTGTTPTIKTTSESTTGTTKIKTTPESTTSTTPTIKTTSESTIGTTPTITTTPKSITGSTATIKTTPVSTIGTTPTTETTATITKAIFVEETTTPRDNTYTTTSASPNTKKSSAKAKTKSTTAAKCTKTKSTTATSKGTAIGDFSKVTSTLATTTSSPPKITNITSPNVTKLPKSLFQTEKPNIYKNATITSKPIRKTSGASTVSNIATTKLPIISFQITKPPIEQVTTTKPSTKRAEGLATTTVPSLKTDHKQKFDPTKIYGITLDPKAKFDISAEEISVTEPNKPAFRPVDNRNYPLNSGSSDPQHKAEKQRVPVCLMGHRGLQCFFVEQEVYRTNLPSNPAGYGLSHPNVHQPHLEVRPHIQSGPQIQIYPQVRPQGQLHFQIQQHHPSASHSQFIPVHRIHTLHPERTTTTRKPESVVFVPIKTDVINAHVYHPWPANSNGPNVRFQIQNARPIYAQNERNPSSLGSQHLQPGSNRNIQSPHSHTSFMRGQLPTDFSVRNKRSLKLNKKLDALEEEVEDYLKDEETYGDNSEEDKEGITLAFVFDTTGSMGPELRQVKEQAIKIANSMLDNPTRPIYDYVFVPFHDENIPNAPTRTKDHNLFINVINKVNVNNGGDCPEKSLGGVIKAINMSRPYSPIYVFTDAYAKDYELEEEIIYLIQRKHPQIFFLTTGYCEEDHHLFNVYRRIAATSSGQVFQTSKKDIKEVLKYVRGSLKKGKVLLSSVNSNTPARTPYNVPISVDKSLKEFTVTASGHNTKINVLNPDGNQPDPKQIKPVLNLNNVKVINVQEPEPGVWTVKVKSNSPYSVVSTGLSSINFVYGFSILKTGNIGETSKRPLKSAGNYLIIKATDATNLKTVTEVKIINLKGTVLDTIPMKEIPLEKGVFGGGPRIPPDEYFKLEINGLGCDGYGVKRVTTAAISPQLPEKPFIEVKEKITLKIGRPYNLTCSIESLVPVSVKLFRYGSRTIPSHYNQTTDITIYFNKISKNDEGTYVCWAKNVAGVELKETQIKVIAVPPEVKVNDIIVARVGEFTRIPCTVESPVEYKVSWYKSKSSRDNCWSNIIPLHNHTLEDSSLIIRKTDLSDEGWYICVASNEAGETRGETYLTVQELPEITTQDVITYQKGNNISIECHIVKGNPIPKLIWYKNHYPLKDSSYKRLENRNTSLILTLFSAEKVDEGIYKCEAVNSIGKANRDVKVVYQESPRVSAVEKDIKITIGNDLQLECLLSGQPLPQLSWWKSGNPINSTGIRNLEIHNNKLIIRKVNISHSGNYSCLAKNVAGMSEDQIKVLIGSGPQFSQPSKEKKIEIGQSDQLYCLVSGHPKPVLEWKHDGKKINNGGRFYLDITAANLGDAGIYQCDAENLFGKAQFKIFVTVTGTSAPIIKKTSIPEIIKHVTGDHVELSCPVLQGKPKPNITWYMNGNLIDDTVFNGYVLNKATVVINQMTARHVGQYECVAENPLGVDRKQILLKLYEPPKIDKSSPLNVETKEGNNVTLECNVSGDPIPLVIWSRTSGPFNSIMRGHKEDGSNNLFFTGVTAEDIGKYVCRAKNIAGFAKQDYALNVIVSPRIAHWPSDVEVEVGNVLSLHCNVYSLPKASIKWLKENNTLYKTSGIYGPYLRFYATSADKGRYSCVAENKAGSDRADVNVIILESPTITSLAPKIEILKGDDLWVFCNATGTPDPEINWYFQGQSLGGQKTSNKSNVLHIERVTDLQNGFYTCMARNKVGKTHKTTEVKILEPPTIKPWENIHKVIPGEEVTMTCEVTGSPVPYITWYKNSQPLTENYLVNEAKIKFIAEKHHSGEYTCTAMNKVGNDSTSLTLIVLEPPIFSQHLPNSLDILLGGNADLPCTAYGDPKPTIKWSKMQEPQKLQESRFILSENGTLKIINTTHQDEGFYKCEAQNKAGSVVRQLLLNVLEQPQATLTAESAVVHEGNELSLICNSTGKPKPRIIWMKDGGVLLYASSNNTLRITVRPEDSGKYSCIVENIVGKGEDSINITVYVGPLISGPREESVIGLKGEDIVLRCQLQGIPKPTLKWIRHNSEILYTRDHFRLTNDSLIMKNLTLSMAAVYKCEAKNVVGTSYKLFRVNIHARPEILNNLITNITLNEGDNYHIACTATGIPVPIVHWIKDRTPIFAGYNDGEILVLEDYTLLLANVKLKMSGIYQCRATNIYGDISRNYSVMVIVPTRAVEPDTHHLEINASDTGTLTCPLDESLPVSKVIWLKDNLPIDNIMHERADDVHFSISKGNQLKLTEAYPEDTGNYTCIAVYPTSNSSSDFIVDVLIRPQFLDEYPPEEYIVKQGETLKIDCSTSGHPMPRVHWTFLDKNLPITEITVPGISLDKENQELLTISSANSNHSGKYICTASNKLGKEKRNFQIIVTD